MPLSVDMIRSDGFPRNALVLTAALAGILAAGGCMSKKEQTARGRLENANGLILEADTAATRCNNAKAGDADADQNVTSAAGEARVAQDLCDKAAALNQQAGTALNSAGTP